MPRKKTPPAAKPPAPAQSAPAAQAMLARIMLRLAEKHGDAAMRDAGERLLAKAEQRAR
jgi:hypothetical protein